MSESLRKILLNFTNVEVFDEIWKNDNIWFNNKERNSMTDATAGSLKPGDKIWLDENNWRMVDDVIYDIATVIDPPTKYHFGRLVINYTIKLGEANMVSSVYPEGCEIHSRVTDATGGNHLCHCDIMVIMSKGCQCNGI